MKAHISHNVHDTSHSEDVEARPAFPNVELRVGLRLSVTMPLDMAQRVASEMLHAVDAIMKENSNE